MRRTVWWLAVAAAAMVIVLGATGCARYAARGEMPAKMPVAISEPDPVYPEAAREAGVEGTAVLNLWVDREGSVPYARVQSSSGDAGLDNAAVAAATGSRFTPARDRKDRPVGVCLQRDYVFRLSEGFDDDHPAPMTEEYMKAVEMPKPVFESPLVYPEKARAENLEGTVLIAMWLRKDGTVSVVRVERSSGIPLLDQAAQDAARQSTFTPARDKKGKPVNIWVHRPYRFALSKES